MSIFLLGFSVSLTSLVAIGSQNLFVLKHGIAKHRTALVVGLSILCDLLLFSVGITFQSAISGLFPKLRIILLLAGAIFLYYQGFMALRGSFCASTVKSLSASALEEKTSSIYRVSFATIAMSLLNPHVYLDTVMIMGNIAASVAPEKHSELLFGATLGSTLWFAAIGYLGSLMSRVFSSQRFWQIANLAIGLVLVSFGTLFMWEIFE